MYRLLLTGCALTMASAALAQPAPHENLLAAKDRIEWEAGGLYQGKLSDGTAFQIELAYPEPARLHEDARDVLANSYWYPRHFKGEVMALTPAQGAPGTLVLERLPDQENAKRPLERFTLRLSADRSTAQGEWLWLEKNKRLTVTLQRVLRYQGVSVARAVTYDDGETDTFVFASAFPVLGKAAADAWVREQAALCGSDKTCRNTVTVRWHSRGQVSLKAEFWGYNWHAAHGSFATLMRHYVARGNALAPAELNHFVLPDVSCRRRISQQLIARLKKQGLDWPDEGGLDGKTPPRFLPLATGIAFHWDPYEVGPWAAGTPGVMLTRAELGNCARNLPLPD